MGNQDGIYVIAAHPHWRESRVNRRLLAAARAVGNVDVNDLYSSYPDFMIDVPAERARLAGARMLVLLHPIQWYSMPPLLLYGARSASESEVTSHIDTFSQRLASYPDWPEMDEIDACPTCIVPPRDRPASADDDFGEAIATALHSALRSEPPAAPAFGKAA